MTEGHQYQGPETRLIIGTGDVPWDNSEGFFSADKAVSPAYLAAAIKYLEPHEQQPDYTAYAAAVRGVFPRITAHRLFSTACSLSEWLDDNYAPGDPVSTLNFATYRIVRQSIVNEIIPDSPLPVQDYYVEICTALHQWQARQQQGFACPN